jgi:hypothetical protein
VACSAPCRELLYLFDLPKSKDDTFDFFIAKLDGQKKGEPIWAQAFPGDGDQSLLSVAAGADRIWVGGLLGAMGTVDFGGGPIENPSSANAGVVATFDP